MSTKTVLIHIQLVLIIVLLCGCSQEKAVYNIVNFGAVGDGQTLNTQSIQKAIDQAHQNGGGKVIVPSGTFLSGTLFLKSNVNLHLEIGAILLGSPHIEDYTELSWGHNKDRQPWHLIYADSISNVAITGLGTIDGNGEHFWEAYEKDDNDNMVVPRWIKAKEQKVSPLIDINHSERITIKDITVKTGGGWNIHLFNSKIATINSVKVINNIYSPNSDGIDLTGCSDITVSDCFIKTCDDAIVIKTVADSNESERISVSNCVMETLCVGIKLGAGESYKDMRDISFSNCVFNGTSRFFGLYSKNGAVIENIVVNNLTGNTNAKLVYNRPIQLMVEKNGKGEVGGIRNVIISNVAAHTDGRILMTSDPDGFLEDIYFRDVILTYPRIEDPASMIEGARSNQFPRVSEFKEAGAARAVFVAENVSNLVLDNVKLNWPTANVPLNWQHPERIENGTTRVHKPDYTNPRETEFSVLWAKNVQGGYLDAVLAAPSNISLPKYNLNASTIRIKN
ncbi:glycosyl hydrolase family 28 protein [Seonamhaeicola sp.]|uniref:glycoside hydrolase family 28 protein n=1 Tax=Seonamhaeicola sp. TaxID=1912245 RepID=UPI002631542B|nr:glycosyl hydrolase family 28 protein [Seonamhaeicola sp.]